MSLWTFASRIKYLELTARVAVVIVALLSVGLWAGCETVDRFYRLERQAYEQAVKLDSLQSEVDSLKKTVITGQDPIHQ